MDWTQEDQVKQTSGRRLSCPFPRLTVEVPKMSQSKLVVQRCKGWLSQVWLIAIGNDIDRGLVSTGRLDHFTCLLLSGTPCLGLYHCFYPLSWKLLTRMCMPLMAYRWCVSFSIAFLITLGWIYLTLHESLLVTSFLCQCTEQSGRLTNRSERGMRPEREMCRT